MEMDNKKKGMMFLLIGGGLACIAIVALVISNSVGRDRGGSEQPAEQRTVSIGTDFPEAENDDLARSKMDAYQQGSSQRGIEDYWDRMDASSGEVEDPLGSAEGEREGAQGSRNGSGGVREVSYEELFGGLSDDAERRRAEDEANRERRRKEDREYYENLYRERMSQYQSGGAQPAPAPVAEQPAPQPEAEPVPEAPKEPERIDVEQVRVTRSNGISTMDDGFGSFGVSSWGDDEVPADENYPFKCMFVRQEKLKNGQRVAVRLLEDMVIDGQLVPRNTHLMATCQITNRVMLTVTTLDYRGKLLSLNYEAYDNDGAKGIYAPDLENSETLEQLKSTGINMGMRRMQSAAGQYVSDLLQAGQMVIMGTGKDRSVLVPAGYQFYLVKGKGQ